MNRLSLVTTLVLLFTSFHTFQADAHVRISSHTMRHGAAFIKTGPCGKANSSRSDNVLFFRPGETITLEWKEFVFHPGYFRISFDIDGDDDFAEPADYFDFFTNETVMHDGLFEDHQRSDGPDFSFDLTLPDVECDNCTLQLIQMMTDKPPYTIGGNDIYYNCLDLVISVDPDIVPLDPDPVFSGGGCHIGSLYSGKTPVLPLLGFAFFVVGWFISSRVSNKS